ncbi:MAG: M14 family zinc carboxypeptidase [Clostridia bacterium]|nr:M14 family zinc carboxypeptidase [Clostridia bacterium]
MFYYKDLLIEMQQFCKRGVETGIVGESELKQQIPYVFVGNKNGNYMIIQAAIHAREHLTALVTVCMAKYLVKHPELNINGGIYFIPMSNPDGVRLCQEGIGFIKDEERRNNLISINGGADFSLWKANADGVDINVNFDANWGEGAQNEFHESPQNYVGKEPFSAAESRALAEFTQRIKPVVTLSYHLKGEEIYWEFGQTSHRRFRDKRYAQAIAKYTGYAVKEIRGSVGGYKDWCVQKLGIPSFTIEVGNDKYSHPFPYEQLGVIVEQNKDLPRRLLNSIVKERDELNEIGITEI